MRRVECRQDHSGERVFSLLIPDRVSSRKMFCGKFVKADREGSISMHCRLRNAARAALLTGRRC